MAVKAMNMVSDATVDSVVYAYHSNKYDKDFTGGDIVKTWVKSAATSFAMQSVVGGKSSSKADGKNRVMSTSKGRGQSESSITCETSYGKSREIIQCNTKDAAADELAKRIRGQSRSAFADDPIQREFDVISDQYIAQAKPPLKCVNKTVRTQMKATFEAAKKYERKIYYQFEGIPSQEVLDKLYEYSERYGVEVIIDTEPLGILNQKRKRITMVTIYAWLEIRATYLDEDLHPEIDEKKVFDDIDNLIKKLKYNELKVIEKNYSRFVQFSVMENHKTERTEEMISMYENITKIATGSYGLLYYLDDEDEVYSDEFRVLVSKKGKCGWKRDENFSPCSIMIEEFD